jgi:hypothetical protein
LFFARGKSHNTDVNFNPVPIGGTAVAPTLACLSHSLKGLANV